MDEASKTFSPEATNEKREQTSPTTPTRKRQSDSHNDNNKCQAKRARLFDTNLQQPAPKPPRASFLEDHVGPTDAISEWLESIGSDRAKRCRSDGYLHASSDDLISRNLTRSAPQMAYNPDADGYVMPSTPGPSYGSVAPSDAVSRRSSRAIVEDPSYRDRNLASNHVYMRERYEQFPEHVSNLVDHVRRDRESPGPSPDEVWQDMDLTALETKGLDEPEVEDYFKGRVFPKPKQGDSLQRADRQPTSRYAVPNYGTKLKI